MEIWQNERLKIIKEILPSVGKNFVLKGGTALALYYGLDRYSEDIDLDSMIGNMDITGKLINPGYEKWELNIKKNTETVFRLMINYGAENERGDYPLKIEISSRNKNLLREGIYDYKNIDGVNVYSLNEILKMKIVAFNDRDKIRDFYDLAFYLNKTPEKFSVNMLRSFKERMDYKNLDALALLLENEFKINNLGKVEGEKIVLETYEKLENLIIDRTRERLNDKNKKNEDYER